MVNYKKELDKIKKEDQDFQRGLNHIMSQARGKANKAYSEWGKIK